METKSVDPDTFIAATHFHEKAAFIRANMVVIAAMNVLFEPSHPLPRGSEHPPRLGWG